MNNEDIQLCDECNINSDNLFLCTSCSLYYCPSCSDYVFMNHQDYCFDCIVELYDRMNKYKNINQ